GRAHRLSATGVQHGPAHRIARKDGSDHRLFRMPAGYHPDQRRGPRPDRGALYDRLATPPDPARALSRGSTQRKLHRPSAFCLGARRNPGELPLDLSAEMHINGPEAVPVEYRKMMAELGVT